MLKAAPNLEKSMKIYQMLHNICYKTRWRREKLFALFIILNASSILTLQWIKSILVVPFFHFSIHIHNDSKSFWCFNKKFLNVLELLIFPIDY